MEEKARGEKLFLHEKYDSKQLVLKDDSVVYKDIYARRIIFCDGIEAMRQQFFSMLPFAINKGEALIVQIDGLPAKHLYKKTNTIVPWYDDLFWVGSSYDRDFMDDQPTEAYLQQTKRWLSSFLKMPFNVVDHLAALRPTTVERRPFAGMHPHLPNVGILNGMGTKGVSLAPFLAKQLAEHLLDGKSILPEADIKQYARMLRPT